MSNIILVIDKIKGLLKNSHLVLSERTFLERLLQGNKQHAGLLILARLGNLQAFQLIQQEIRDHLLLNPSYKKNLKAIYKELTIYCEIIDHGSLLSEKKFRKIAAMRDYIYRETVANYSGTVMLPIIQTLDYRLGNSKGECSGYVLDWIQSFLLGKRPFNIDALEEPLFEPILLSSPVGRRYPSLNHGVPLTESIARLQQFNILLATKGMDHSKGRIHRSYQYGLILTKDKILSMGQALVKSCNNNPNAAFYLSLRTHTRGHALGLFKDKNGCLHFLDVNSGWYRFKNDTDFIRWLPFYFSIMKYPAQYDSCWVHAFGIHLVRNHTHSIREAVGFFAKSEFYLFTKRVMAPFSRAISSTLPIPPVKPTLIEDSRDDAFINRTRLSTDDLALASFVDIDTQDFASLSERASKSFPRG